MASKPNPKPAAAAPKKPNWRVTARTWHGNLGVATALTLGLIALSCPFIAHGDLGIGKTLKMIHYGEFLPKDLRWIWIDSQGLALGLLIVSGWLIHRKVVQAAREQAARDASSPGGSVAIVYQSAQSEAIARNTARELEAAGFRVFSCNAEKYPYARLNQERWLFLVADGADAATQLLTERIMAAQPAKPFKELRHAILWTGETSAPQLADALTQIGSQPALEAQVGTSPEAITEWNRRLVAVLRTAANPSAKAPRTLTPQPA
jgi:hypothetical protein